MPVAFWEATFSTFSCDIAYSDRAASAPLGELEDGDGDPEMLEHLVEQSMLLPAGAFIRAQADQDVVRRKLSDRIFEREQRVIGPDLAVSIGTQLGYVPEDRM
jgi:hypothetical protein